MSLKQDSCYKKELVSQEMFLFKVASHVAQLEAIKLNQCNVQPSTLTQIVQLASTSLKTLELR